MSSTTDPVAMLRRQLDNSAALWAIVEAEWYNGNIAQDVYDRIHAAADMSSPIQVTPLEAARRYVLVDREGLIESLAIVLHDLAIGCDDHEGLPGRDVHHSDAMAVVDHLTGSSS